MQVLLIFGAVTSIGTAVLTVAGVWKLLMGPLNGAIHRIEGAVSRLENRVEQGEAKRESDIKDLWKHLAERKYE